MTNVHLNELGYFVVGFLCEIPEEEAEKIIRLNFPKSADNIRYHVAEQKKWEAEHPGEYLEDDEPDNK